MIITGQTFTVTQEGTGGPSNPPSTSSLNPNPVLIGTTSLNLEVNGSGFVPGAKVRLNGNDRNTQFNGPELLFAFLRSQRLNHFRE